MSKVKAGTHGQRITDRGLFDGALAHGHLKYELTVATTRKVVEVVVSLTQRATDVVSKHFVRVDVTGQFPYPVPKLSPYYDR